MKFLICLASLALVAGINANPYGSNRGYGGGYNAPRIAYVSEVYGGNSYGRQSGYGSQPSYGGHQGGYGGRQERGYGGNLGGYGGESSYARPLIAESSNARAAASAAANGGSIRPGNYKQAAVVGYEIDASIDPAHGYNSARY